MDMLTDKTVRHLIKLIGLTAVFFCGLSALHAQEESTISASRSLVDTVRVGGVVPEGSVGPVRVLRSASTDFEGANLLAENVPVDGGVWEIRDTDVPFGESFFYWAEWDEGAQRVGPAEGRRQGGQPDVEHFERLPAKFDFGTEVLTDLIKGEDRWVLLGDSPYLYVSFDEGANWETHPMPVSETTGAPVTLNEGVFAEGLFVAVRQTGRGHSGSHVYYSEDAINWTRSTSNSGLSHVAYGNGVFYAHGTSEGYVSGDGRNWTYQGGWNSGTELFAFKNKFYKKAGGSGFSTSTDGQNWTYEAYSGAPSVDDADFFFAGEDYLWMGVAERDGYSLNYRVDVYRSSNGTNWGRVGWTNWLFGSWIAPHSQANGFFYANDGYGMLRSSNMLQWERVDANRITAVREAPGGLLAYGAGGFFATSVDGANWTGETAAGNRRIVKLLHGNGTWVALPEFGQPFTSADGENWSRQDVAFEDYFHWIDGAFADGTFVLLGGYTRHVGAMTDPNDFDRQVHTVVAVSNDGFNWELRTAIPWDAPERQTALFPNGVSYANGHFYLTTQADTNTPLWRSEDGLVWEAVPFASTLSNLAVWGITHLDGRYYLYGARNRWLFGTDTVLYASDDLAAWTDHGTGLQTSLRFLEKFNGRFFGSGTGIYNQGLLPDEFLSTDSIETSEWRLERGIAPAAAANADDGGAGSSADFVVVDGMAVALRSHGVLASSDGDYWFYSAFDGYTGMRTAATGDGAILVGGENGVILRALPAETDAPVISEEWTRFEREYGADLTLDLNPENEDYSYSVVWYEGETGDESQLLGTGTRLEFTSLTESLSVWYRLENEWGRTSSPTIEIAVLPPVPEYTGATEIELVAGNYYSFALDVTWTPDAFHSENLPAGLVLNSDTGRISGIPAEAGEVSASFQFVLGEETGTAEIVFNVLPAMPVITSPAMFSGQVGRAFTYEITVSGEADSVSAQNLPAGLHYDSATRLIHGTPSAAGSFNVILTAANQTDSDSKSLALTIRPSYQAPAITSSSIASATAGAEFQFTLTAQAPVDSYRVESLSEWLSIDPATGILSGTPPEPDSMELRVSTMKDGVAGPWSTIDLSVEASPDAPRIEPLAPIVVTVGGSIDVAITTNIPADSILAESATDEPLPTWLTVSSDQRLTGAPPGPGKYQVNLVAFNDAGRGPAREVRVTVLSPPEAPSMTGPSALLARVGEAFSHQLESTGGTIAYEGDLPAGITLTGDGRMEGIPAQVGLYEIFFYAADGGNLAGPRRSYTLQVEAASDSPDVKVLPELTAVEGDPFSAAFTLRNGADDLEIEGLPDGLRWEAESGQVIGVPEESGEFLLEITAFRAGISGVSREVILTVAVPLERSRLLGPGEVSIQAGQSISLTYSVDLGAGDELLNVNILNLPDGLDWEPETLTISGAFPVAGTFSAMLAPVSEAGTGHAIETVFHVSASAGTPRITNDPRINLAAGEPLDLQLEAVPGPATAFQAAQLPEGISLDRRTGRLTGIIASPGTFPVEIFAANDAGSGPPLTLVLAVEVGENSPVVQTTKVWNLVKGEPASLELAASNLPPHDAANPLPDGYGYRAEGLPEGIVLDSQAGVLSGTPVTAGTFAARLSAYTPSGEGRQATLRGSVGELYQGRPFIEGPDWVVVDAESPTTVTFTPRNTEPGASLHYSAGYGLGVVQDHGGGSFTIEGLTPGSHVFYLRLRQVETVAHQRWVSGGWFRSGYYRTEYRTVQRTLATKSVRVYVRPAGPAIPAPTIPDTIVGRVGVEMDFNLILPDLPGATYRLRLMPTGLPAGIRFDGTSFHGTPTEPGEHVLLLVTQTPEGTSVPANLLFRIFPSEGAPVFAGITDAPDGGSEVERSVAATRMTATTPSGDEPGGAVRVRVGESTRLAVAADGDVEEVIAENLPDGLSINPFTGIILGVPTRPGLVESSISLVGNDGRSARQSLAFEVLPTPGAPDVVVLDVLEGRVGVYFSETLEGTGELDGFWVDGLPDGLELDSETGQITGSLRAPGTFSLSVSAFGPAGESMPSAVTLAVRAAEGTPAVTTATDPEGQVGVAFSLAIEATASPDAFRVDGLPEGLYFDEATATIEGTPAVPGIFEVRVQASNTIGWGDGATVLIDIQGRPGTVEVVADEVPGIVRTGQTVAWNITSSDADAQYSARGLPGGLSIDPVTGVISGTPNEAGVFTVSLMAINQHGTGSETRIEMRIGGPALNWLAEKFGEEMVLGLDSLHSLWTEDTDGDGYNNLLEYSLGGDPHQPKPLPSPEIRLDSDNGGVSFVLWRSVEATDIDVTVEQATDPGAMIWETLDQPDETIDEGELRKETFRDLSGAGARGFYRVRVDLH